MGLSRVYAKISQCENCNPKKSNFKRVGPRKFCHKCHIRLGLIIQRMPGEKNKKNKNKRFV